MSSLLKQYGRDMEMRCLSRFGELTSENKDKTCYQVYQMEMTQALQELYLVAMGSVAERAGVVREMERSIPSVRIPLEELSPEIREKFTTFPLVTSTKKP